MVESWSRQQMRSRGETKAPRGINPESEAAIQANFFEWIDLHIPKHSVLGLMFAVPNEGNKSKFDGWKRQLTGRRAGVPDTCLPVASRMIWLDYQYIGLFIEFKSKTGKVSAVQQDWIDKLRKQNHRVEVCRSWTDAANIVIEYLGLDMAKL